MPNEPEVVEEVQETETTEEAPKEELSDEEKLKRLEGGAARLRKKLGLDKPEPKETKAEPLKGENKDFDYSEKAFLVASGVSKEDFDFVREVADQTGKSLDEVLESKYFQAELKDRKEQRASANALPTDSKRSGQTARDTVDYWLAKGELPPENQPKLRREYVNARIKKETDGSKFSSNPVV